LSYQVELDIRAQKDLKGLDPQIALRIVERCSILYQNPIQGPNISRLKLRPNLYRLRIGNYRIAYIVESNRVIIKHISHRKDIYRSL